MKKKLLVLALGFSLVTTSAAFCQEATVIPEAEGVQQEKTVTVVQDVAVEAPVKILYAQGVKKMIDSPEAVMPEKKGKWKIFKEGAKAKASAAKAKVGAIVAVTTSYSSEKWATVKGGWSQFMEASSRKLSEAKQKSIDTGIALEDALPQEEVEKIATEYSASIDAMEAAKAADPNFTDNDALLIKTKAQLLRVWGYASAGTKEGMKRVGDQIDEYKQSKQDTKNTVDPTQVSEESVEVQTVDTPAEPVEKQ